ncbi:MAG TPA: Zn-dependent hydrolase [Steroidobacteraceae bacterium]|jgi:N-carbamoyl-L-amino-acid hydrolase|nr:Zn-dependent hydrolase [Steroidobacteraceae bacterium]
MTHPAPIAINVDRLIARIDSLAEMERKDDGSCSRLALTDADRRGRDQVIRWMHEAGLAVRIDQIGNITGLRSGRSAVRPVMTGSHIDTVANGGRYDGIYGVIAGLEALQSLRDADQVTERPLALTVFTNEEGVRFQPDMMGSLVYSGGLTLDGALNAKAKDGVTLGDELNRIGYAGTERCGEPVPHAFIELHIEQGPILDRESALLGAVENLQGISWQEVTIRGVSNHAGTTPMQLRRDAGYCAARVGVFVRELAKRMGASQVGTVGSIRLTPDLINVIPNQALVSVDLRNTDDALLSAAEREFNAFLAALAREEVVTIETRTLARTEPVVFDSKVLQAIETVAAELGLPIRRMTSGAGHDAQMMARICPSAMIFVPSVGGISHNPREFTARRHLQIGADALLRTMLRLAAS